MRQHVVQYLLIYPACARILTSACRPWNRLTPGELQHAACQAATAHLPEPPKAGRWVWRWSWAPAGLRSALAWPSQQAQGSMAVSLAHQCITCMVPASVRTTVPMHCDSLCEGECCQLGAVSCREGTLRHCAPTGLQDHTGAVDAADGLHAAVCLGAPNVSMSRDSQGASSRHCW